MSTTLKQLEQLTAALYERYSVFTTSKYSVYRDVYAVEQAYEEICAVNKMLRSSFLNSKYYIMHHIPFFEWEDYKLHRPLLVFDKDNVLKRADAKALKCIRSTFVQKGNEKVGERLDEVIRAINEVTGMVDLPQVKKIFKRLNVKSGNYLQQERVRSFDSDYSEIALKKMGMAKLIKLFLKVLRNRNYYKRDRDYYKRKCLAAGL